MRITGISNGALLQRDENSGLCRVYLEFENGTAPKASAGELRLVGNDIWEFSGLPVGGPYEVTFSFGSESRTFVDIFVGDLWLLAGQSNMEGAGRMRSEDYGYAASPDERLRAFYMEDRWRPAHPQLHKLWLSSDACHRKVYDDYINMLSEQNIVVKDLPPEESARGVGPGYFFARRMFELTGVPQGLIPAAVGGAPIEMWAPVEGEVNYYSAACRRVRACGRNIRGIFWYQGEGFGGLFEDYTRLFESMRKGLAELCRSNVMPCVQVQTAKCTLPFIYGVSERRFFWSRYRDHLLKMSKELPALATVPTNDLALEDCVHIDSASQEKLGIRGADAMYHIVWGEGEPLPEISGISAVEDRIFPGFCTLEISYANTCGGLCAVGNPSGFSFSDGEEEPSLINVQNVRLEENKVLIRFELGYDDVRRKKLWYGFGVDFNCSISDGKGRPLPSQGPIELSQYI